MYIYVSQIEQLRKRMQDQYPKTVEEKIVEYKSKVPTINEEFSPPSVLIFYFLHFS